MRAFQARSETQGEEISEVKAEREGHAEGGSVWGHSAGFESRGQGGRWKGRHAIRNSPHQRKGVALQHEFKSLEAGELRRAVGVVYRIAEGAAIRRSKQSVQTD